MRAIVFDFFGTLTDPAAELHRQASFTATADALGLPLDAFWAAMSDSFPERIVGRHRDTRLDAAVFSWQEGRRKPDPVLYATAAGRLGVTAAECWFVGDGGSREHDGARRAGMRPVLVTNAAHPEVAKLRSDPDQYRPELLIDDLGELPALLRTGRSPAPA